MSFSISTLDRLFLRVRAIPFFYRFTLFTRVLLAAGFIPTGWVKLMGRRFTSISTESPIGAFFEAMYQTGEYWQFIGACQMLAGLLLLLPATAHLGALLFVPIMTNIYVVTMALEFRGTTWVTGFMLLAVLYLCAWDYHRFRGLLSSEAWSEPLAPARHQLDRVELFGFAVFGCGFIAAFLTTRGGIPNTWVPYLAAVGLLGGFLALGRFITHGRRSTTGVVAL